MSYFAKILAAFLISLASLTAILGPAEAQVPTPGTTSQSAWGKAQDTSYSTVMNMLSHAPQGVSRVIILRREAVPVAVLLEGTDGTTYRALFPSAEAGERFISQAERAHIEIVGTTRLGAGSSVMGSLQADETLTRQVPQGPQPATDFVSSNSSWLIPIATVILLLVGLFFIQRHFQNRAGQASARFADSKAKKFEPVKGRKTFADVAGADEAKVELMELVEAFREKEADLKGLGGSQPRCVLLIGPPGNGKTLLARAVAGEADADFFSISGSEFVEMFVGVGAARVRDLFATARKSKRAIIFIDEIDAVGRQRGTGVGGGNDEREQTLNQLLVEIDGFDELTNILVMAATNRPDVLDPALLRPGRFGDLQVLVDAPDLAGRQAILHIHLKDKQVGPDADVELLARNTVGMSGAQLEGICKQGAIIASRRIRRERQTLIESGKTAAQAAALVPAKINMVDLNEGIDRVLMGPAKENRAQRMSQEDKLNTAVHEAGHADMAHECYVNGLTIDPVTKITIVPRARALGYMVSQPEKDSYSRTREYMVARIMVALAGRAAQEVILGKTDSGASNDFEQAWNIAYQMVAKLGMSRLGIISVGEGSDPFLGRSIAQHIQASTNLQALIEEEQRRILSECYEQARRLIVRNRARIDRVVSVLMDKETVLGPEFLSLMEDEYRDPSA
jgi:cell division protease FtsH